MSEAGKALAAHYGAVRVRIVVESWKGLIPDDSEGEPAVYAKPYTLDDDRALSRFTAENNPEGFAEVIVRKAETESGEKLFDVGDKPTLMTAVPKAVLSMIASRIMVSDTLEDAKKN